MKYYILDDDMNIIKILQRIIEEDFERFVIGYHTNPEYAIKDILNLRPDIVLIDYLMPHKDGSDVLKEINAQVKDLECIMISQVSDKAMIEEAYQNGLSFFISKPINRIEVNVVLSKVEERLKTQAKLQQIFSVLGSPKEPSEKQEPLLQRVKNILQDIGIYSEKGAQDVISIIHLLIHKDNITLNKAVDAYCDQSPDESKIIRQRMRRAIYKGLRNIAYLGIEDNLNENYLKYSTKLYDFETVKQEMDHIRGNTMSKGSISMDRFLRNIIELNT